MSGSESSGAGSGRYGAGQRRSETGSGRYAAGQRRKGTQSTLSISLVPPRLLQKLKCIK